MSNINNRILEELTYYAKLVKALTVDIDAHTNNVQKASKNLSEALKKGGDGLEEAKEYQVETALSYVKSNSARYFTFRLPLLRKLAIEAEVYESIDKELKDFIEEFVLTTEEVYKLDSDGKLQASNNDYDTQIKTKIKEKPKSEFKSVIDLHRKNIRNGKKEKS